MKKIYSLQCLFIMLKFIDTFFRCWCLFLRWFIYLLCRFCFRCLRFVFFYRVLILLPFFFSLSNRFGQLLILSYFARFASCRLLLTHTLFCACRKIISFLINYSMHRWRFIYFSMNFFRIYSFDNEWTFLPHFEI